MKAIADLAPWSVYPLPESPFSSYWCMNPSIVRIPDERAVDGARWLCSVRCSNYHMPGSTFAQRPKGTTKIHNRNLMLEIDPQTWRTLRTYEIFDRTGDANKGMWTGAGFEDLRLIYSGGQLCALGSAMRPDVEAGGVNEIVLLELGSEADTLYQIIKATPLRGTWSNQHQKNWSPFQGSRSPLKILYSPLDGGVHDPGGRIVATHLPPTLDEAGVAFERAPDPVESLEPPLPSNLKHGAIEVGLSRRVPPIPGHIKPPAQKAPSAARLALRGGTQLVKVPSSVFTIRNGRADDGRWVALAHGCRIDHGRKTYWHQLYEISESGDLLGLSEPFKLDGDVGIEFAAGFVVDPDRDRAVISFGLEDDRAMLGVTSLSTLVNLLRPIGAAGTATPRACLETIGTIGKLAREAREIVMMEELADRLDAHRSPILSTIADEIRATLKDRT